MRNQPDHFSVDDRHRRPRLARVTLGAVGALVLVLLVMVIAAHQRPARIETSTPASAVGPLSPSPTATSSTAPTPTLDPVSGDVVTGPPSAPAVAATGRFVDAWLSRGTPAQRRQSLTSVTAPSLLAGLVQTDPDLLPRARRVGAPRLQSGSTSSAIYRADLTDGTAVLVDMVLDGDGGWKATAIQPAPAG